MRRSLEEYSLFNSGYLQELGAGRIREYFTFLISATFLFLQVFIIFVFKKKNKVKGYIEHTHQKKPMSLIWVQTALLYFF